MHSNLTAADVAKYFGCSVVTKEGTTGAIVGVFSTHQSCNIGLQDGSISVGHLLSDCHLLLKPLSELSEDDAVEVAKIGGWDYSNDKHSEACFDKEGLINHLVYYVFRVDTFFYDHPNPMVIKDLVDYLRSKGYDMDNYLTTNKAKHG